MKGKSEEEEIKSKILDILEEEDLSLSIRQVTIMLKEKYGINKSPQVIKRYLESLAKEKKIRII